MKGRLFKNFMNEKYSAEKLNLKKGKWQEIDKDTDKEIQDELFDLVNIAYAPIGGHAKINKPEDIFKNKKWNYFKVIDVNDDPYADLVVFGNKGKYGVKWTGVGHNGEKSAKKKYLKDRSEDLTKTGFFGEVSDNFASILLNKYNVPTVNNQEDVEKVLGKKVKWNGKHPTDPDMPGNGWYTRSLGGHDHAKILVGKPKGI